MYTDSIRYSSLQAIYKNNLAFVRVPTFKTMYSLWCLMKLLHILVEQEEEREEEEADDGDTQNEYDEEKCKEKESCEEIKTNTQLELFKRGWSVDICLWD